jgi:hypothetical protein
MMLGAGGVRAAEEQPFDEDPAEVEREPRAVSLVAPPPR